MADRGFRPRRLERQVAVVHFRHTDVANVLYLDGHAEAYHPGTRNQPPPWEPMSANALRDKARLFDIGSTDELWDLE